MKNTQETMEPGFPRRRRVILIALAVCLVLAPVLFFMGRHAVRQYVFGQLLPTPLPLAIPPEGLPSISAESCGSCHEAIHEEWKNSGMGRAFTGVAFQADWKENQYFFFCLNCHAPLENQQPLLVTGLASLDPLIPAGVKNPHFDPGLREEGVTCVVCHLRDGEIAGPHECETTAHLVAPPGDLGSADHCGSCHQFQAPFTSEVRRPLSDTVEEWRRWQAATGRTETCVECHMPAIERPVVPDGAVRAGRRHLFLGSRDVTFLGSGLRIEGVRRDGDALVIEMTNLAGHNYPSGEPARALEVRALLRDRNGSVIAKSSEWLSRRVLFPERREKWDTTLRPGETREIRIGIEASRWPETGSAQIEVRYHRLHHLPHARAAAGESEDGVLVGEQTLAW